MKFLTLFLLEGNLARVFPWGDGEPKKSIVAELPRLAPLYGKAPDDKSLMLDLYGDTFFRVSARSLVAKMERAGAPAWHYHFDYVRRSARKNSDGAGHGAEVPYVFGSVVFPGPEDRAAIHVVQGHWIQFAKTGNPNAPGLPDWPATTAAAPTTMVYGNTTSKAAPAFDKAKLDALDAILTKLWPEPPTAKQ